MSYKLVVFDFDGTLADTFPWFLRNFDRAAERFGFDRLDRANAAALRGLDARAILRHHRVPLWKVPAIARFMRARMAEDIAEIALFAGMDETLESLAERGCQLAVVSSNTIANVRAVLGPANAQRIRHYECGASLFGKARRLRRVLAASGVAPANAILVGDELRDGDAAREAGIAFAAVAWGYTRADALAAHGADLTFASVAELAAALA